MITKELSLKSRGLLGFSLVAFLAVVPAQANLLIDGNFTANPTATSGAGYQATTGHPGGWSVIQTNGGNTLDCVVTGGATVNTATADVCGVAEGQNWGFNYAVSAVPVTAAYPTGGNYFAMDGGTGYQGPLYQTIAGLTAGSTYTLNFYEATDQQYGFSPIINAFWGVAFYSGSAAPTVATTYTPTTPILETTTPEAWTLETFNFVATSSTQTLAFLAGSTNSTSAQPPFALLSDVTLTAAPEPSTLMLFGLALLAIPALRFARKKRV